MSGVRNFGSVTKIGSQPPGFNTGQGTGGNAIAGDVLSGKTFTNDAGQQTGSMTNKVGSATVITPSTSYQTIPQGFYGGAAGDGKVSAVANATPGNIRSGVTIAGVAGSSSVVDTSDANANAGLIYTGYTAYVNGVKLTGTLVQGKPYASGIIASLTTGSSVYCSCGFAPATGVAGTGNADNTSDGWSYGVALPLTGATNWVSTNINIGIWGFGTWGGSGIYISNNTGGTLTNIVWRCWGN